MMKVAVAIEKPIVSRGSLSDLCISDLGLGAALLPVGFSWVFVPHDRKEAQSRIKKKTRKKRMG